MSTRAAVLLSLWSLLISYGVAVSPGEEWLLLRDAAADATAADEDQFGILTDRADVGDGTCARGKGGKGHKRRSQNGKGGKGGDDWTQPGPLGQGFTAWPTQKVRNVWLPKSSDCNKHYMLSYTVDGEYLGMYAAYGSPLNFYDPEYFDGPYLDLALLWNRQQKMFMPAPLAWESPIFVKQCVLKSSTTLECQMYTCTPNAKWVDEPWNVSSLTCPCTVNQKGDKVVCNPVTGPPTKTCSFERARTEVFSGSRKAGECFDGCAGVAEGARMWRNNTAEGETVGFEIRCAPNPADTRVFQNCYTDRTCDTCGCGGFWWNCTTSPMQDQVDCFWQGEDGSISNTCKFVRGAP